MAATNFTPIQLYHSTTASAAPVAGNLANGELAINITDGKLFYKDNGGTVQVLATKATGTIGGSNTQVQYNNAGVLAGSANFTFDGTTATINTLNLTTVLDETYGGTGNTSYTTGDLLYASASNTLSKLTIGTNGYILTSNGTTPAWTAGSSISVNTADNLSGGAAGSVPYQSGPGATTFLGIGAANRVLTSSGTAPQWVTSLTGLTGVSSSGLTNTSLTSGRVVYSTTGGAQTDSASLTFNGTTLTAGGFATGGSSTLDKLVKIGDSAFNLPAVLSATAPAKLYVSTATVTDASSAPGATNVTGTISALGSTTVAASNTGVTYTNLSTLYIAGAPTAGTNITITNPYALYVAAGKSYFGGDVVYAGGINLNGNVTIGDSSADTLTINSTITSNLIFTDNTYDIGASGATRPRNLYLAGDATVAGNTVLGDAASDYVQVNGYMGVGGSPSPSAAIYVTSTALTSGYQVGVNSGLTGNSSATAGVFSFYGNPRTAASSFTSSQVVGFYAEDATKGAGSTITSQYGVFVNDQTKGTNNYGVASFVSAASNKWNIYASGSAPNYFNGSVGIGTVSPSAVLELYSTSNIGMFISRDNGGAGGGTYLGFREKNAAGSMLIQNSFNSYWNVATTGNEQSILTLSQYRYGSTGEVLRVQNGNVGMGLTPSGWSSSYRALQIGSMALWSAPTGAYTQSYYTNNLYYDGSTYRYQYDGAGASYTQNQGSHQWLYASTGTANASASVANLMFLDTSARLYVNAISYPWIADFPNVKMYVAGEFATSQGGHIWFGDTTTASPCGIGEGLYNNFGSDSDFLTLYYRSSLRWYTGTTEVARATNDGDFLLGTTTLTGAISGSETTMTIRGRASGYAGGLATVNNSGTVVAFLAAGESTAHGYLGTSTNNNLLLYANNAEVGQITSDGSLIMGDQASGVRSGYGYTLAGYQNRASGYTPANVAAVTRGGAYTAAYICASNPGFDWQFGKGAQTGTSTDFEWGTNGGGGTVLMKLNQSGNLTVHGSLSKGSGSFVIDHPLPEKEETHYLVHSFIEGPQADLIYRGRVNLVNGRAEVNIDTASGMTDGTFVLLCRDVQCYTSNESDWIHVRGFVTGNILTIEAQDQTATSLISWMVIGERQDKHMLKTEWTDETGKIIVEPTKASRMYDPTKDPMNPECPDYDPTLKPIL